MSPIISTAVSPTVSIVPYPTPTPVEFGPLGDSSPTAIIIAWVLTAFLPIPLMLLVTIFRYSPDYIPNVLSRCPLPRQLRANGSSGGTPTANPSTPSSRTLTVSNRSSDTLPVVVPGQCPSTPSRDGHGHEDPFNPRTPIHSLEMNRKSSETPSKSTPSPPMSVGSPSHPKSNNTAASPLASCFESPKHLGFLEPPGLLSSTGKKPYTRLSDGSSPRQQSVVQPPATPHMIHRRRLKHRLLISTILFGLIFAMYVLDGFAIAAAHRFAHVRVLSRPNGTGGLGAGKEDERWLAPWTIYIFLQGSMVAGCAWMVWAMRRELRHCDEKWTSEKGKGVVVDNKPDDDDGIFVRGSVSPPRSKSVDDEEEERFLPPPPPPPEGEGEEEEPDWRRLGFHPTFASEQLALSSPSTPSKPAPASTVSLKSKSRRGVNRPTTTNLHYSVGESSSSSSRGAATASSSSSPGSGSSNPFSAFTLPAAAGRSSGAWWKHHRSNRGYKTAREEDEEEDPWRQILPSPLTTTGDDERGGNSWAQEVQREADLRMSRSRSKGKGKEIIPEQEQEQELRDEEEEEEEQEEGFELKPVVPRELLTGIDLSKPYQFTDGLAYPLFPLKAKPARPLPPSA
ncbi:MAG: hypothetical protein Q9185_000446 [Variospora sp. 1 TL-2023]